MSGNLLIFSTHMDNATNRIYVRIYSDLRYFSKKEIRSIIDCELSIFNVFAGYISDNILTDKINNFLRPNQEHFHILMHLDHRAAEIDHLLEEAFIAQECSIKIPANIYSEILDITKWEKVWY